MREVIAVEPSAGMRGALRTGMGEHGIANVRVVAGAWPESIERLGDLPAADVGMIAHVGYDIEAIGPFLDAMEAATRERCVAVLTDRSPASVADPFWPLVHGEDRVPLPALPDLLEVLHSRGRQTEVIRVERPPRTFDSVPALTAFLRRQLFISEGGEKDLHFRAVLPDRIVNRDGGWTLLDPPAGSIGIVTWGPRRSTSRRSRGPEDRLAHRSTGSRDSRRSDSRSARSRFGSIRAASEAARRGVVVRGRRSSARSRA